jgi:hypothetical protein
VFRTLITGWNSGLPWIGNKVKIVNLQAGNLVLEREDNCNFS